MVFSSPLFLTLFLPIVFLFYVVAKESYRKFILLISSIFFYAWGEPKAVWIMLILILISYGIAILIEKNNYSKFWLILGILFNLSALFYYKYWNFFIDNVNYVLTLTDLPVLTVDKVSLPIGISFYVFQIMSYLIDVYRKEVPSQKNFCLLAMYISLFPQLVAGPIVRYQTVLEDINSRSLSFDNIYYGTKRFIVGLAKKILIADNMGFIADTVFNSPVHTVPTVFAWVGILAYALQIYYDFSGYSDMAIGIGRIFNFKFLENFNYPYCSKSIQEFWRRWHISLSSWLRDYLYIPLGGNRKGKRRAVINSCIVFALCGLWHGATWNFVVWGLFHGLLLLAEKLGLKKLIEKLPFVFANIYVWLMILIGWVFFRSNDLPTAFAYLKIMFMGNPNISPESFCAATQFISYSNLLFFIFGFVFSYPIFSVWYEKIRNLVWDNALMLGLFFIAYVFAMTASFSPFIYFRF